MESPFSSWTLVADRKGFCATFFVSRETGPRDLAFFLEGFGLGITKEMSGAGGGMGGRATDLLTSGWVGLRTWASTIGQGLTSISAVPSFEIALFPVSATAFFFICPDQFGFLIHQFLNYSKTILLR
ncbi:hypothetical protein SLEP1_g57505, partial [Rubroshorea leprosula]